MVRFNADDLFEMAESLETWGEAFYRDAAAACPTAEVQSLLSDLAAWEGRHRTRFHELRQDLPDDARTHPDPAVDDDPDLTAYIETMMRDKVFPDNPKEALEGLLDQGGDEASILRFALAREKDTIAFFLSMQSCVPKYWGKERVSSIVDEELRHVHLLTRQLGKLGQPAPSGPNGDTRR